MASSEPEVPASTHLRSFHELMQWRARRILLVSSLYDSFIMSEEGHLQETLLSHFIDLHLTHSPDLVRVPDGEEALALLEAGERFDLVVASLHSTDVDATQLAKQLRGAGHELPVIALAYTGRELHEFVHERDTALLERIFLWQGDVRILLAMVMYLEDRLNVPGDTGLRGVPAILVVEDSVRFYSSFLPAIYSEVFRHTHRLLSEDLNPSQKMLRMRARPKVLLCETYEEAWDYFERYESQILGVISDVRFPKGGELTSDAGLQLCRQVLDRRPDVRLVLQSSEAQNRELAEALGASFLLKGSPLLLQELRTILVERFGFGDFVFRGPDGTAIDRASDLRSLGDKLRTVPADSIAYHGERNHFSNWLKARTEFALAERLRPQVISGFETPEHLREHILRMLHEFRLEQNRSIITEFDPGRFEPTVSITRIGAGSLGGKARGVAFANRLLRAAGVDRAFPGVEIYVPPSVVLGTEVFDTFLEYEHLRDLAISDVPDEVVERAFLDAPFPRKAISDLRAFLQKVRHPLAVRSSSLLEDSLSQPFAGVYKTFMLPNNEVELEERWLRLARAVKRVYASAFTQRAKAYLSMTSYRLEEEKMAVMLQELVGDQHGERFYPDFAGVARSYNFYPEPGHDAEDGVAAVALGFGQAVVGGEPCLRFNPRYPQQMVGFSSVQDALENTQRGFFSVDLTRSARDAHQSGLRRYDLDAAEQDGRLTWLGSTWVPADNRVVDGISREGVRLVSFAQVLKHGAFPLAEILETLLRRCSEGTGGAVEIEFAGSLATPERPRPRFAFLQLRPLALAVEHDAVELGERSDAELVCRSEVVLGNGRWDEIRDLVVVQRDSFERRESRAVAQEVARCDALLRKEGRPYALIGVGRWGSSDPSLGIPVSWNQIAGARVIVEAGFRDFKVKPSQGTHFFQNLVSSSVGYFTVNPDAGEGFVDWSWLSSLPAEHEAGCVRLLRLSHPLEVRMDGRQGAGIIAKPSS